jgi:hypothetical protein
LTVAPRPPGSARRRTGPADEEPWWDAADQAAIEQVLLRRRDLGKGWLPMPMVNNAERFDPLGTDPGSEAIRAAREQRHRTALDEGSAWRHRRSGSLAVLRLEVFASADDRAHRQAWVDHGAACLGALWRERWRERDVTPGWIEALWCHRPEPLGALGPLADQLDWLTVEDQTGSDVGQPIMQYEHVTMWVDRAHAVVTVRHELGTDLDEAVVGAVRGVVGRLAAGVAKR